MTPPTADVTAVFGRVLIAAIRLADGDYRGVIDTLETTVPYEHVGRLWPAYLRGLAYGHLQKRAESAAQFESVIERQREASESLLVRTSQLQLARARVAMGDTPAARQAYGDFLAAWNLAGRSRVPLVAAAVRERAAFERSR